MGSASRQGQNSAGLSPGFPVSEETTLSTEAVREPNPWNEGRLNKIIQDEIEECLTVEYKGAPAISREQKKTSEITKDISSMANSAGGLLIYGVAGFQTADKKHLPERLDPVDRLEFTKEWIEHIASQIRPRIAGLRIYPVQLTSGVNHVAYVVEIPEGTTAHQATDFRYYRRYNFESVPMADHEVRDVMARKANPSVSVGARFVLYQNGRLALELVDENGESIATLSVNMPERSHLLGEHEFFAKTWSENGQIAEEALASGLFLDTGRTSGDVVNASIWTFK